MHETLWPSSPALSNPTGERWHPIQSGPKRDSSKDAGAVVPHKYSMLKVQPNCISKGGAFHIPTFTNKVFDFVAMTHRRNALGNDRTRVEFSRDVMRRGTNELDAALMRTVIRLRASKSRKERMMDVDHPSVPTKRDRFRENPHVAG